MSALDDKFGKWLQIVVPSATQADRDARLSVVRAFASTITLEDVVPLTLLFYKARMAGPLPERLRTPMRSVDMGFSEQNDAELAVLGAGVLYHILERGSRVASASALA